MADRLLLQKMAGTRHAGETQLGPQPPGAGQAGEAGLPSLICIDLQPVKAAPFVGEETEVDGNKKINGRKRHVITDTLGLVWGCGVGPLRDTCTGWRRYWPMLPTRRCSWAGSREPAGRGVGDLLQAPGLRGLRAREMEMGDRTGFWDVQLL